VSALNKSHNDEGDVVTAATVDDTVAALIAAANTLPPLPEGWIPSSDPRSTTS
jgi:hypothetical protein